VQRVFRLPLNPTCENLASIIVKNVWDISAPNVHEIFVTVWENEKSKATDSWVRE
jgi:hypothetical protein